MPYCITPRRVNCPAPRPGSQRLIERNEMLDALKVAVEAIFDLGLHVQILPATSASASIFDYTQLRFFENDA